jgi:hypothetical protein
MARSVLRGTSYSGKDKGRGRDRGKMTASPHLVTPTLILTAAKIEKMLR